MIQHGTLVVVRLWGCLANLPDIELVIQASVVTGYAGSPVGIADRVDHVTDEEVALQLRMSIAKHPYAYVIAPALVPLGASRGVASVRDAGGAVLDEGVPFQYRTGLFQDNGAVSPIRRAAPFA